jgi:hypothetical protein
MLSSRYALQDKSGHLRIGQTKLIWDGEDAAWLYVSPEGDKIAAGYHGPSKSKLRLTDPEFSVEMPELECGILVWENGEVRIEAYGMKDKPQIKGASLKD